MALTIKHTKVSTIPDGSDPSLVLPSDWNADHALTGVASVAQGGTNATTAADARTNLGVPATDGTGATGAWPISVTGASESAFNVRNGQANQIPVQGAPSVTNFIAAPTITDTFLKWTGTAFAWATAGGGGGNVNSIIAGTGIAIDPPSGQGNVTINATGGSGGVTQIIAGTNVTIDPVSGVGSVTINAAGSGSILGQTQSVSPFETAIGFEAGNANTGVNNTYMGYQAGRAITGGTNNVAVGYQALDVATIPAGNVVIGSGACGATTGSSQNVVIGFGAAGATTLIGADCVIVGNDAGRTVTGTSNILIGSSCGNNVTTGTQMVGIGVGCFGTATAAAAGSVAVGNNALGGLTSGARNTAIGGQAGAALLTGSDNTFVGFDSGKLVTGNENTFVGSLAGDAITSGGLNTFVGAAAGGIATTGSGNTFIGRLAGNTVTTGGNNTIIGNYAGISATMSNFTILADGVGNPRLTINNNGAYAFNSGLDYGRTGLYVQSRADGQSPVWSPTNRQILSKKVAAYTLTGDDQVILAFVPALSPYTLTLPTAVGNLGLTLTIKRTDSNSAATLTVDSLGGLIEGAATATIGIGVAVTYISDNIDWFELANG